MAFRTVVTWFISANAIFIKMVYLNNINKNNTIYYLYEFLFAKNFIN